MRLYFSIRENKKIFANIAELCRKIPKSSISDHLKISKADFILFKFVVFIFPVRTISQ